MGEGRDRGIVRAVLSSPESALATFALVLLILAATLGPVVAPQNPYDLAEITILDAKQPPGTVGSQGFTFLLGTDGQGRDLLSAIAYGLRTSLIVGIGSGALALAIGGTIGLTAGYLGGRFEAITMRLADLMLGFPALFVALMVLALLGRGLGQVMLALVLIQWAPFARVSRSAAVVERARDYTTAAVALGLTTPQILLRHLLPNCLPPISVVATLQVANAIAIEATLSFLGVGLPISEPSLGLLVSNGYEFLSTGLYWISLFPGLALVTLVLSINLLGDRLREFLNPRLRPR